MSYYQQNTFLMVNIRNDYLLELKTNIRNELIRTKDQYI